MQIRYGDNDVKCDFTLLRGNHDIHLFFKCIVVYYGGRGGNAMLYCDYLDCMCNQYYI